MAQVKIITLDLLEEYNRLKSSEISNNLKNLKTSIIFTVESSLFSQKTDFEEKLKDLSDSVTVIISSQKTEFNEELIKLSSSFNENILQKSSEISDNLKTLETNIMSAVEESIASQKTGLESDFNQKLTEFSKSISDELTGDFNTKLDTVSQSLNQSILDVPTNLISNGFLTSSNLSSVVSAAGCILADKTALNNLIDSKITDGVPSWAREISKPTYTAEEVGALSIESNTEEQVQNIIDVLNDLDQKLNSKLAEYDSAFESIDSNFAGLSDNINALSNNVSLLSSKVTTYTGSSINLESVSTPVIASISSSISESSVDIKPSIVSGGTYKRKTSL